MGSLPDIDTVLEWRGRTVIDRDGEKVGKFEEIYLDTETDRPEWGNVKTGRLGLKKRFVPLSEAEEAGENLQVPWEKEHIDAAPDVDPESELSRDQEAQLYRHYGLEYSTERSETGLPQKGLASARGESPEAGQAADRGAEKSAPSGADREGQRSTPSETASPGEDVQDMATEAGPRERVRLRKYVVTEHVTRTVPVQREEVRVEREPIGDDDPNKTDG